MTRSRAAVLVVVALLLAGCTSGDEDRAEQPSAPALVRPSPAGSVAPTALAPAARVEIAGNPDYLGLSTGVLWTKTDSGAVVRLDPVTLRQLSREQVSPGLCQGFGVYAGQVWSCTDDTIVRLDAKTGRPVTPARVARNRDQTRLPVAFGRVWVLVTDGSNLVGVETRTGADGPRIPLGRRCTEVEVSSQLVWVTCPSDGLLLAVDPTSGKVVRTVPGLPDARTMAISGDDVWVGYRDGIARVSASSGKVVAAVDVVVGKEGAMAVGAGGLWVRSADPFLRRVSTTTLKVDLAITADLRLGSLVASETDVWATAYNDDVVVRVRPQA